LITLALAWAYARFGRLPQAEGLLYGVKPVIIAVVVQALIALGRTALKTRTIALLAAAAAIATALGIDELLVLLATGALSVVASRAARTQGKTPAPVIALIGATATATAAATTVIPFSLPLLFGTFLKIGSVLFGSGYVLLAFLRNDFVHRLHWLTEAQLLDAVAVGQVTPGPVFTTATFIGYLLGGTRGAAVATAGIFLPAFVFVAISGPLVPRLRKSPTAGAFLDGVNAASLALMAVVTAHLGRAAIIDIPTVLLAIAGAIMLLRFRVNSLWLVLGGAAAGVAIHSLR
jgi:chromate transporter